MCKAPQINILATPTVKTPSTNKNFNGVLGELTAFFFLNMSMVNRRLRCSTVGAIKALLVADWNSSGLDLARPTPQMKESSSELPQIQESSALAQTSARPLIDNGQDVEEARKGPQNKTPKSRTLSPPRRPPLGSQN